MLVLAFSFLSFLKSLLMFFFVLSALLLTLVVLLQEPKGGGLSSAFGGAGAETFGVQSRGVNKFTAWVAGIFMGLAILYAAIREGEPASLSDTQREPAVTPIEGSAEPGGEESSG